MAEIRVVNTPQLEKLFLQVHLSCHRGNPDFIRPLDKDIRDVFDPKQNKAFRHGDARRWILLDDKGDAVGRIAAFTNSKYKNKGDSVPVGGIGFFDCINDQKMADQLFETAKDWLAGQGMEAMDGPINFGDRDRWWGLLVEGFEPPVYGMNYNPPYYQALFEKYGFQTFYNQICWSLPVAGEEQQLEPKFYEAHQKFASQPDFEARHIRKNEAARFAHDFCTVYNKAWAIHEGNKDMEEKQALKIFNAMKAVMDPELVWFAYHKGEPAAMWISIPDINQIIKYLNGKFHLLAKLEFVFRRWRKGIDRMVGIIFGVVPEFQGEGLDYYLIVESEKVIKANGQYKSVELEWQGDFNPKIIHICENLGAVPKRRLITYRYLFDRNMPFQRHPIVNQE